VVLVFSILITWAVHLSLCDFINFIISSRFILCLKNTRPISENCPRRNEDCRNTSPWMVTFYTVTWTHFTVRLIYVQSQCFTWC
jgi:hypothetical protein